MASNVSDLGERLVNVRAIVMVWDEKYCGWQPLEGGGVSSVALYQRLRSTARDIGIGTDPEEPGPSHALLIPRPSTPIYEYIIYGEKEEDRKVTLQCPISKRINYRQVMPTFHHWQIGENKYGLKFMNTYGASKFQNRLQKAVEHLRDQSKSSTEESNGEADDVEDDVFVPVELPPSPAESWESGDSTRSLPARSATTTLVPAIVHPPPTPSTSTAVIAKKKKSAVSATGVPSEFTQRSSVPVRMPTWPKSPTSIEVAPKTSLASAEPSTSHHYPKVYYQKDTSSATVFMKPPTVMQRPASTGGLQPSESFLRLSSQTGRSVSLAQSRLEKTESISSLKVPLVHRHHTQSQIFHVGRRASIGRGTPTPSEIIRRERCLYCKTIYYERDNVRGACPSAPDPCAEWIRRCTCIWCAEYVVVRCCNSCGVNGDIIDETNLCSCSEDVPMRTVRWTVLVALSMLIPCLCLYPPLSMCHRQCKRRGWIGGRHRPSGSTQSTGSRGMSSSGPRISSPEASSSHHR